MEDARISIQDDREVVELEQRPRRASDSALVSPRPQNESPPVVNEGDAFKVFEQSQSLSEPFNSFSYSACFQSLSLHGPSILCASFTVVAISSGLFLSITQTDVYILETESWRWLLYFGLWHPSWLIATFIVWGIEKGAFLQPCSKSEANGRKKFEKSNGFLVFWSVYPSHLRILLWSLLQLVAFVAVFGPSYGELEGYFSGDSIESLPRSLEILLIINSIFVLYCAGVVIVDMVEFKYLHKFSMRNINERIENSIFEEVLYTRLCGLADSRATNLLSSISTCHSNKRNQRAASNYIRKRKLATTFSVPLSVSSSKRKVMVSTILKKVVRHIKLQERRHNARHQFGFPGNQYELSSQNRALEWDQMKLTTKKVCVDPKRAQSETPMSKSKAFPADRKKHRGIVNLQTKVIVEVLSRFLAEEEVERALSVLGTSLSHTSISLSQLKEAVKRFVEERKHIIRSLKDGETVTAQIKVWIQLVVNTIILIIGLIISGVNSADVWIGFTTFIVGFSFVFGGAIKTAFENFLYIYGSHPFEVGDSILIGTTKQYTVERVLLQTTELSHFGETRIVQNSVIRSIEPLINLSRSTTHFYPLSFIIDAQLLKDEFLNGVNEQVESFLHKNKDIYSSYFRVDCHEFRPPVKVVITLIFGYEWSLEDLHRSNVYKSKMAAHFCRVLLAHGAKYTPIVEFPDSH